MDTTEKKPPVSAGGAVARAELALVFSAGEVVTPPRRYRPGREPLRIGRDAPGGIPLPTDPRASRRHASAFEGPSGALCLVDEGSTNGTWLNGVRVTRADLAEGDVITVGDSLLVVGAAPEGHDDAELPEIVGTSAAARRLRSRLARAALDGAPLLLFGESGCGEEIAARALHALSGRTGPFVAVNCGAVPGGLTEGQLFGQAAGALGAAETRSGLFGAAEGGTLFLDDIGELNPTLQPKLLRALRERVTSPIGTATPRPVDVRVIAATNRALGGGGRAFLAELYAYLTERALHVPPLRDRREDVLVLLAHAFGTPSPKLEVELAERLLFYDWPYNLRELRSLAKQLRIRSGEGPYELDPVEGQLTPRPRRVAKERPPADLATVRERTAFRTPTPREGTPVRVPTPLEGTPVRVPTPLEGTPIRVPTPLEGSAARPPTPREGSPGVPPARAVSADTLPPRAGPASTRSRERIAGAPTRRDDDVPPREGASTDLPHGAEREAERGPASSGGKGREGRDPPPGRAQLVALLRRHGGVVSEVARAVSRSRKQVYRWLEHHGLDAEAFRR
ncbi:MAG TPA: sigma 54-interacting transcriptional regulator [Polyangiaceae bacterium]|nr:sigma 54-interacting transcriptional regulator [Polyangiaceae bacterium]